MLGRHITPFVLSMCLLALSTAFPVFAKRSVESNPQQSDQLKAYYNSGKYLQDMQLKIADAKEYLDRQLQYPRPTKLAIVLDVDETALSNYRSLERMNFSNNTQALIAAYMLNEATPLEPVLNLYQYANSKNVSIFFVSSRPNTPEMLAITEKHLKSAGYDQWQELLLMPIDKPNLSIADFKTTARRHITNQGYDIILNVGDHDADLVGGYAEVKVKLPNPFYAQS